jgi:beta-carotene 15,15'-monooxygenase
MYALTEINFIIRVDPKDLSVLNRINLTSHVPTATTNNAHPHIDNVDGSWLSVAINFKNRLKRPRYEFIRYKAAKNDADLNNLCNTAQVICTIPSSDRFGLSYFHSFGITQNYIILLEQSIKINFFKLIKTALFNRPFSECMVIEKEFQTRIHVIRKENGEKLKQKYLTEPLVAFHHINAYETFDSDNNNVQIICDLIAYNPDKFDISKFTCVDMYTERTIENDILATKAKRLTIPIRSESSATNNNIPIYCDLKELNSFSFEMPCINYSRVNGLKYKYVYGTNYYRYPFSVVKINVDDPNEIFEMKYAADENQDFKSLPSEPVFVERPGATSEDDGVVLVLVLSNQSDYLSILDAKDLKELAKAELNTSSDETEENKVKACFTFHGFFASSSSACSKIFEKS